MIYVLSKRIQQQQQKLYLLVYKALNNLAPSYIKNLFQLRVSEYNF